MFSRWNRKVRLEPDGDLELLFEVVWFEGRFRLDREGVVLSLRDSFL